MSIIRRAILALVLIAGIAPAMAQVPPPVPALPDVQRQVSFNITTSTCACSLGSALNLYGDSTDYQNWVEVWLNGVQVQYNDATFGWTITSPTGQLATIPRPITDGVLTFNNAQTGTVVIVGALRPRRTSQFSENQGVSARNLNQAITYIISSLREFWDKLNDVTGRAILGEPGDVFPPLPPAATRANGVLCFNGSGVPVVCAGTLTGVTVSSAMVAFVQAPSIAAAWAVLGAIPTSLLPPGLDLNALNAQGGNYPIVAADTGHTIYVTGGPFTVTLPAITGFASNAQVRVCNGNANSNTTHAQRLSGFPNPIFARLYQQTCVSVAIENGAWVATVVPGRFRPTFVPVLFVDNSGSDANDGLISNASGNPLQTMSGCLSILKNEYDLVGFQPACSPTGGQTFVGSFAQIGMSIASSVFLISGNGGQAVLRPTANGTAVLTMSDYAGYVITTNVTFDCTGGNSGGCFGISFHQESGADLNNGTRFIGAAATHEAINCDGRCKVNFNSDASPAVIFSGSYLSAVVAAQNSTMVAFNGLTLDNGASTASDYLSFSQGVRFQFRGALNGGAGTSVAGATITASSQSTVCLTNFTTSWSVAPAQKFKMLNFAMLFNVSANALPGTASGVVTGTGFANGAAPDSAGGNTGVNASGC